MSLSFPASNTYAKYGAFHVVQELCFFDVDNGLSFCHRFNQISLTT
jgi:hypothetical protein